MPLRLLAGCVHAAAESTSPSRARPASAVRPAALCEKRISRLLVDRASGPFCRSGKCGRPEGAGRPRANPDGGRTGTLFRNAASTSRGFTLLHIKECAAARPVEACCGWKEFAQILGAPGTARLRPGKARHGPLRMFAR